MRVNIVNLGAEDIRVITDQDGENDSILIPGMDAEFVSDDNGTIELRELGSEDNAEGAEKADAADADATI